MKYFQNICYLSLSFIWQTCKVGEVLVEESWPGQDLQGQGVVRVGRVQVGGRGAAGRGGQHLLLQQLLQGRGRNQRRRRAEPRQQRREWRGSWRIKIFLVCIKYFSRNIFLTVLRGRRRCSGGVFPVCRFVAEERLDAEAAGLLQQLRLEVMLERLFAHPGSRFEVHRLWNRWIVCSTNLQGTTCKYFHLFCWRFATHD